MRIEAKALPNKLKKLVTEDLHIRGKLVNNAQDALADAISKGDLSKMVS